VGFGAFDQLTFDLYELVSAQFRQPSGAAPGQSAYPFTTSVPYMRTAARHESGVT
jgi:hypothetical protein